MHYADLIEEIIHAIACFETKFEDDFVDSALVSSIILMIEKQSCPRSWWIMKLWFTKCFAIYLVVHWWKHISFYEQHRSPTPVIATPSAKLAVNPWKRFLPLYSYSRKHIHTYQALFFIVILHFAFLGNRNKEKSGQSLIKSAGIWKKERRNKRKII